jgi:nucleoside-diphosphate-sugar epimerase
MMVKRMAERCVVTGGAGFIGSWLCKALLEKGYGIVCVDNLITGSKGNIEELESRDGFVFLEKDVSDLVEIEGEVDYVFHLASPASPVDYQNYPIETMLANSLGTLNMLNLARSKGARFLMASTSEVYGDPEEHPQKESYWGRVNPIGPRSCYDESKRFAEALVMSYLRKHGMDVRIIRIFNTYGPRMGKNDGRVIPNFINQALGGKPITVYGDGEQTRSYCYVSDMVEGIERVMFSETSGEVFNIGNSEEFSVLETADVIKRLTGSSSEIVFEKLPEDDPTRRRPDISKIRKSLGWEPGVGFEEGLRKTVEDFKQNRGKTRK